MHMKMSSKHCTIGMEKTFLLYISVIPIIIFYMSIMMFDLRLFKSTVEEKDLSCWLLKQHPNLLPVYILIWIKNVLFFMFRYWMSTYLPIVTKAFTTTFIRYYHYPSILLVLSYSILFFRIWLHLTV